MQFDLDHNGAIRLCVLFADIAGSSRLYESLGDGEAARIVKRCLEEMKAATHLNQGVVVETIGDEILSTFPSPGQAAFAAKTMMRRVQQLPPVSGNPLSLRIGFHYGPVLKEEGKIFGDTVNTAARIVSLAKASQVFASKASVELMPPLLRDATRDIASFSLKGKREEMDICELLWDEEGSDLTIQFKPPPSMEGASQRLALGLGPDRLVVYDPGKGPLSLGRGLENDVVIDSPRASRRHARIELRRGKFVLTDSSTNGTWVLFEGEGEVMLRHEDLALHGRGLITLGHPYDHANRQGTLGFDVA